VFYAICKLSRQETIFFFSCPFALSCWEKIHIQWDCSVPISDRILRARNQFRGPCFMETFVCAAWNVWKLINDQIFNSVDPTLARWCVRFKHDLQLHTYRVKPSVVQPLSHYIMSCFD
jgi:hypothetical protein